MSDASLSKLDNPTHPVNRTLTLIKLLVLAVSVAAAVPTARNLYFSWKNGVPFDQVDHRLAQAALLEKNFDCKISYRAISMQGDARIEVGSCPKTGDISIRVKAPSGQVNYEWIAFEQLPKPRAAQSASAMNWLVASAIAGEVKPLPEGSFQVAQDIAVLCQSKDGGNIIRVVKSGNQCVRETVSIFRGAVEKSETVPCDSACPIK